ncbi:MAG: tetratricopeptide repeat protein [Vicinamibacterales bacterium]
MKVLVLVALLGLSTVAHAAQSRRPSPEPAQRASDSRAEAYEQYLLAQRLDSARDREGAIAALKRAMALDPASAELPAALAELYLDMDQSQEASAAAQQALTIDPDNRDAHRILGTLFAAAATDAKSGRDARQEYLRNSLTHLEKAAAERAGLQADANLRAMLARLYILNGDYEKAIPLLTELVRQEQGWEDGPGLLVDAYVSAGRTADAITWLQQHAPENPQLFSTLADLYGREQKWSDAAAAYEEALRISTRSFDLRVRYASMLMNTGGVENVLKARAALREAIQMRATDERALYLLSNAERLTHEYEAAESAARKLIAQNGRNPRGYYALAEVLEQRQQYQGIVDALGPVVPEFRGGQNASFTLGLLLPHLGFAYHQLGRYPEAIATFEEAQKLAPQDLTVTGFLIQSNLSAKRYEAALSLARAARTANPGDLRFARLESQVLRESGRVDEGLAVLENLLKTPTSDADAHLMLARAYIDANRGTQAVRVLQDAQTKFPGDPSPAFELGAVFEKQKRYADAESAFKEALQRDPKHAPSLNYLGYMLAERGERLTESVNYIKQALEIEPNNGSYLDSLGWAYFKDGQLQLAEDVLKRAATQLATNSVIQDHYGDVLFKLGRYQDAIEAWDRALAGDADDLDRDSVDRKIKSARQKLPRK